MFSLKRDNLKINKQAHQTLFHFLKKKKQVPIQALPNHRKISSFNYSLSNIETIQNESDNSQGMTQENNKLNTCQNITRKKILFEDVEQKKQPPRKNMIHVISTCQDRHSNIEQIQLSILENTHLELQPSSLLNLRTKQQQSTEKQLNNSFLLLRGTMQKFFQMAINVKQNFHSLFIELSPILSIAQEHENKQIKRKANFVKEKLKLMQYQLSQLAIGNGTQIISAFEEIFTNYLVSKNVRNARNEQNYYKIENENCTPMQKQKDIKMDEYQNQEIMQKIVQQQNKENQELQQSQRELLISPQSVEREKQTSIISMREELSSIKQKNIQLSTMVEEMKQQESQKDKKFKDILNEKQLIQQRLVEEIDNVKSARESSFISEFSELKQEFHNDMKELTQLYISKEKEYKHIIENQKSKNRQLKLVYEWNKQNEKRNGHDLLALKTLIGKYRKQNENLVTDMHQINQQLYQHWSALRDIKILATTFRILPKLSKIYSDIPFNDHLFS